MFHKTSLITAIICVLSISGLFAFLFVRTERELSGEQKRMEKYIDTTASQAINVFRNEILYLYEHYSTEIHGFERAGEAGENISLKEIHQLVDFPDLIEETLFIKTKEAVDKIVIKGEEIALPINDPSGYTQPLIHINNFQGYMVFPYDEDDIFESSGFIIFTLNIRPAVESYLIDRLLVVLFKNTLPFKEDSLSDYEISCKNGLDIQNENRDVDLIIDLNRSFNLGVVKDYYYIRPDSFQSVTDTRTITDNHLYLSISHRPGTLTAYFNIRRFWIYGGISLLYIFLVVSLLLFLYSTHKTKVYYQREQHFTSLISHELKTPLSVIQLAADSLSGGHVEEMEAVTEYGTIIKDESSRLGRMIENILLLSTRSWEEERTGLVSIDEITKELRIKSNSLLKRHNVTLDIINNYNRNGFQIKGTLLIAALQNLIHNAIVYGAEFSEDKKVILNIEKSGSDYEPGITFSVIDHGPGISWTEAQKIFDSYYRGTEATEKQLPGSGMGLAISRKIADELGGSLQLKKTLRRETVFELWIPNRMIHE